MAEMSPLFSCSDGSDGRAKLRMRRTAWELEQKREGILFTPRNLVFARSQKPR